MGYAYNFKNEEEDLQKILSEKIENAYNKMQTYKWENTANKFKEAIKKLA